MSLTLNPFSIALAVPSGATLQPGSGWTGPTAQPGQIGSGQGADRRPIAHWDAVPYQTVRPGEVLNIGVLAYHFNEISRVEFSVNNGPWVPIDTPTMNPQTKAEEYWVRIDPSQFLSSGKKEIRAIAYPVIGIPRVLQTAVASTDESKEDSSLYINVEHAVGALPHEIRYATVNGNDANACTQAAPCLTLARALQSATVGNSLSGAEIRLGEGTWHNGALSTLGSLSVPDQWLTITSIPGINWDNVRITGWRQQALPTNFRLIRVHQVNVVDGFVGNDHASTGVDYLWFDDIKITDTLSNLLGLNCWTPNAQYNREWFTDVYAENICFGLSAKTLTRNFYLPLSQGGYSTDATPTLVNIQFDSILQYGALHADTVHFWGRSNDRILYGVVVKPTGLQYTSRGIAGTNEDPTDVVVVNSDLHPSSNLPAVFSFCGNLAGSNQWTGAPVGERFINHFLVINSRFVGGAQWCAESGVPVDWNHMNNILIKNSIFENGTAEKMIVPYNASKIRYVPAIGSSETGITVISPNGTITKSPTQTPYGPGANVTLTATPLPGYQFDHWVGDLSGASPTGSVTLPTSGAARVKYAHAYFTATGGPGIPINQPPQVNAGVNQSIILPSAVTFNATATDDGLPNPPGAFTVQWAKINGPGTVTFGNAAVAATNATFSQAGTYVLRLTANDSVLSSFDDVQISVLPTGTVNQGPEVSGGGDITAEAMQSVNLEGDVSDDGLPNPPGVVTSLWEVISGPGAVNFSNATNPATSAIFTVAGAYVLRLTASDSVLSASDQIQVTVESGSASLTGSQETKLIPCMNPSNADDRESPPVCFSLESGGDVKIDIYSRSGRLIRELVNGYKTAGEHRVVWDRKDDGGGAVSSSIYNVLMDASGKKSKIKIPVIR